MKRVILLCWGLLVFQGFGISQIDCGSSIEHDIFVVDNNLELQTVEFCLPIENKSEYEIYVNGSLQTLFNRCGQETLIEYDVSIVFFDTDSPFNVESWGYNGYLFSGEFNSVLELVDSMNVWNSLVHWEYNEVKSIIFCSSLGNEYMPIEIEVPNTGNKFDFSPIAIDKNTSTSMEVKIQSSYVFEIINVANNCIDSFHINNCIVDAGLDRNLCPDEIMSSPSLRGEIKRGSVVDVSWMSQFHQSSLDEFFYASSMLSDTTILQPIINQHFEKTVVYYLFGRTENDYVCLDSVQLNFSDWSINGNRKLLEKQPNDTVGLWAAYESNWNHVKYEWTPNYMLSDSDIESPLVWNDTTVFYNLEITDELNCTMTDEVFEVHVTSIDFDNIGEDYLVYPNPAKSLLRVESSKQVERLQLLNLSGVILSEVKNELIDVSNLSPGQYVFRVYFFDSTPVSKMILVIE